MNLTSSQYWSNFDCNNFQIHKEIMGILNHSVNNRDIEQTGWAM